MFSTAFYHHFNHHYLAYCQLELQIPTPNTQTPNTNTMAATTSTSFTTSCPVVYGRSGYNKDGNGDDDEDNKLVNYGRSGYNK